MSGSITLGRLFGIRFAVSPSWFPIFFLVAFSLGAAYFPDRYPTWPAVLAWTAAVAASLLFFACVVLHELAHSLIAIRNRIPVRSITLFLFGGVSHISADAPTPRVEFSIALAGPLTSLGLAALFGAIGWVAGGDTEAIGGLCLWLAWVNLTLGVFNLVPGFPLDGGRLLRSLVWFVADDFRWATRVATGAGQLAAAALVIAGLYLTFGARLAVNGLWLVLIGWFLFKSATDNYQGTMLLQLLDGLRARDVLRPDPPTVDEATSAQALAEEMVLSPGRDLRVVTRHGEVVGLVGHRELRKAGAGRLRVVSVGRVMQPLEASQALTPDVTAAQTLQLLAEGRFEALPVLQDGRLLGLVYRDDLLRVMELRRHLRSDE